MGRVYLIGAVRINTNKNDKNWQIIEQTVKTIVVII